MINGILVWLKSGVSFAGTYRGEAVDKRGGRR
jgi:hypothetical protein